MPNEKAKKLYEALKANPKFKNIGSTYEVFEKNFSEPEKGKKLYQALANNPKFTGIGSSYEAFSDGFGLKKKDLSAQGSKPISKESTKPSQAGQGIDARALTTNSLDLIPEAETTVPTPLSKKAGDKYLAESLQPKTPTFTPGLNIKPQEGLAGVFTPKPQAFGEGIETSEQSQKPFNPLQQEQGSIETPIPFVSEQGAENIDPLLKQQMANTQQASLEEANTGGGGFDKGFGKEMDRWAAGGIDKLGTIVAKLPSGIIDIGLKMPGVSNLQSLGITDSEDLGKYIEGATGLPEKYNPLSPNNGMDSYFEDRAKKNYDYAQGGYDKGITGYLSNGEYAKAGRLAAGNVLTSLPITLGIIASRGAGISELGTMGAVGVGTMSDEYKSLKEQNPNLDKNTLFVNAVFTGGAETLTEYLGTGQIFNYGKKLLKTAGKEAAEEAIRKGFKGFVDKAFRKAFVGVSSLDEGLTEGVNTLAKNWIDRETGVRPDANLMDGVVDSFIVGVGSGATLAGPFKGMEIYAKSKNRAKATELHTQLNELLKDADNPNLDEKSQLLLTEKIGDINEKLNDLIDEADKLPDEAKAEAVKLLERKEIIDETINNGELSPVSTQLLLEESNQIDKQLDEIGNKKPTPEETPVTVEWEGDAVKPKANETTKPPLAEEQAVETTTIEEAVQPEPSKTEVVGEVDNKVEPKIKPEDAKPTEPNPTSTDVVTETNPTEGGASEKGVKEESIPKVKDYGHQDINETENVTDLANMLYTEANTNSDMSEIENAIRDYGLKVDGDSYRQTGDKNNITQGMAKTFFKKGAGSLDTAAMEINNIYFNGQDVVQPQDLAGFMERYPDGGKGYSSRAKAVREKLYDITGKSYNKKTVGALIKAEKKTNEGKKVDNEIVSLINENDLTLENLDNFKPILEFLFDTKEEVESIQQKIKTYLENGNKGRTNEGNNKGSGPSDKSGGLGGEPSPTKPKPDTGGGKDGADYEGKLKEAEQSVKAKEQEVAKLQADFDKASKSYKDNLSENQTGMFENKTQSMFDDKSDQTKIYKEKKAKLDKARQELLEAKANVEAVKDSKNQTEFDWDAFLNEDTQTTADKIFDTSDVKPITDFIDSLKIKQSNVPFSKILPVVELYNGALEIIKTGIKAGNSLKNAIKLAVDYLKESGAKPEQIKGFEEDIKGKFKVNKKLEETVKKTIRDNTDARSKAKVVMNELDAIKKQFKDFERGFKEGNKEGKKTQQETQKAYDEQGQIMRDKLLTVLKNIKDLKLFNGNKINQNGMINMVKSVLDAGNSPRRLARAVDNIAKRLNIIDYDNKVREAKADVGYLQRKFFKGNQITVSDFLALDPSEINVNDFYRYKHIVADLKAHADANNPFTIGNFDYVKDFTEQYRKPSTEVKAEEQPQPQKIFDIEKPNQTLKDKVVSNLKKFRNKFLDYRKGMPKHIYRLFERMGGKINLELFDASLESDRLTKLLSNDKTVDINDVDNALRGDLDALNNLPQKVAESVVRMRQHIDKISHELIDKGFVKESQMATIEVNMGKYLNRSYELFNNKDWTLENLPEPLYNKASQLLANQYYKDYKVANPTMSEADIKVAVENRVKAKIAEYFDKDNNKFFNQKNDGSKDLSIMMERSDIPVELRELFGERKDPIQNYLTTIHKMASLAEANRFLHGVRESSLGTIMFEKNDPNRPADAIAQIAADGSETLSPLNGLYMTKELADAFKNADDQIGDVAQAYLKVVGAVKWGKTVGSIITHFKNIEGNIGFVLANGHIFNSLSKDGVNAVGATWKNLTDKTKLSDSQINDIIRPMIELGVIDQSVTAGELNKMFDINNADADTFQRLFNKDKTATQKVVSGGKLVIKKVNETYQAEDNMFKIFAFLSDRKRYSKALHGKEYLDLNDTEKTKVDEYVAEVVKNTYPTFSRVPKISRIGSMYVPFFGNFVSFQAEAIRTSYNITKMALKEVTSDNPKLRVIGAQRIAGITTYTALKNGTIYALSQAGVSGLLGLIGDDDEEKRKANAARNYVAPFSRNSDLIVLPSKNGELEYVDLSSYDPFGLHSTVVNAAMNGKSLNESFANSMMEIVSPFVDKEITASMLLSLASNRDVYDRPIWNPEDDFDKNSVKIAQFIGQVIEPGTFTLMRKLYTNGDSKGSYNYGLYRTYKSNISESFRYKMSAYKKRIDDINKIYYESFRDKNSTREERDSDYLRANAKYKDLVAEMKEMYESGIYLGAKSEDMKAEMTNIRLSNAMKDAILRNNFDKIDLKYREDDYGK